MSLSFFNTSLSGLSAAMKNIQVTSHNISNVNTPGYSRQQAISINKTGIKYGNLNIGQGVEIKYINRIRNEYLDEQFRKSNEHLGYYETMQEGYSKIENLFGEPSDTSISSIVNEFWNSLSELSKNPESTASRNVVIQATKNMINSMSRLNANLKSLSNQYTSSIEVSVENINSLSNKIHLLNEKINESEVTGQIASDLRDQRDNAIDELSKLINIDVYDDSKGGKTITIGGRLLVGEGISNKIEIERDNTTNTMSVFLSSSLETLDLKNGQLASLLELKNSIIPNVIDKMNTYIASIANEFNAIHKNGFGLDGSTNLDFFVSKDGGPINIENITINPDIISDPNKFAASANAIHLGDNENLRNLIDLKNQKLIEISPNVNVTFSDYYVNLITGIGVQSETSNTLLETHSNNLKVIDLNRMSVHGVSLDEEITNLSAYQHAYSANARMISVLDEMLETLIGMV